MQLFRESKFLMQILSILELNAPVGLCIYVLLPKNFFVFQSLQKVLNFILQLLIFEFLKSAGRLENYVFTDHSVLPGHGSKERQLICLC